MNVLMQTKIQYWLKSRYLHTEENVAKIKSIKTLLRAMIDASRPDQPINSNARDF